MNVLTGQEVVNNLCELLLSKFKILHRMALISNKLAYVGRMIISLLAFESFMSGVFFFIEKNNLPSGLIYYLSGMFPYSCFSVQTSLWISKKTEELFLVVSESVIAASWGSAISNTLKELSQMTLNLITRHKAQYIVYVTKSYLTTNYSRTRQTEVFTEVYVNLLLDTILV